MSHPPNVTVVGLQWGDEGKGKIVDWLASRGGRRVFRAVVRFNGGHNAGHSLSGGGRTCVVTLVPSGVLADVSGVIAAGVVVDPFALLAEIDRLSSEGLPVTPASLRVDECVALVLPVHQTLDRLREAGPGRLGTTGRGIGPACEDRVGRRALRLCDLADPPFALERLRRLLAHTNVLLQAHGGEPVAAEDLWPALRAAGERLAPYMERTGERLRQLSCERLPVLFEGAQSVLLDIDHGTYPYVTASSCIPGAVAAGAGMSPRAVGRVLGVTKAYATRVGAGPLPTEMCDAAGEHLAARGKEVGTNTGRPRRCGWLDAALLRQACRVAGVDRLAITKLDVLDGLPEIKIGVGYVVDGREVASLPPAAPAQTRAEPVYETHPGWSTPVRGCRTRPELPAEAVRYLRRIRELVGVPVAVVSTGPDRGQTMTIRDL